MKGSIRPLAVLLTVMFTMAVGCGLFATIPETCEELAPRIVDLSEENESPSAGRILKFYDIKELDTSGEYILRCSARAALSRGGDANIIFYLQEDQDGDQFIGYESR